MFLSKTRVAKSSFLDGFEELCPPDGQEKAEMVPPRVFVKGRYIRGVDECLRIVEDGCLGELLEGLLKSKAGYVCEVCM